MPRFMTSDGAKLFYERFGDSGEPLIFIHPPLMGHVVFKYQCSLQAGYRVILYDLRGHGHSTRNPEDYSFDRHVEDIKELIDELELPKVTLVGYSAGGSFAMEFALRYPERTHAIILSGGFPKVEHWVLKQEFNAGIALMKRRKVDFLSQVLAWSHKITSEDQKEFLDYGRNANPDVVLELYRDCFKYNCVEDLEKLNAIPTLVLYGTIDFHIHYHLKWFENRMPNAEIIIIDKGTHQLPTRFHEPFNHAMEYFLTKIRRKVL